ncbi:FCS-Like Zinc finger 10-like [Curcuma longa]|uniref:FCS-Like Zinc finger 10-like n=1 Tax=Curcuma longa TaxID=136217 RepID=UPI003D9F0BF5
MLRKRSRSVHKDPSKEHLMPQTTSCSPFPNVPGLLVGFISKGSSDCGAVWSPTPAGIHGRLKCWDSSRVGLRLLDCLIDDEETKPCGKASGHSGNRNIVFGSQMRNNASAHDYGILSQPQFGSSKPHSCSSGLVTKSFNNAKNYLNSEVRPNSNFQKVLGSLPIAFGSSHRLLSTLSSSEIEQSEDYTCIISHGPSPKLTHIFGDCILESHITGSPSLKKSSHKEEEDSLSCSSCKLLMHCVCCDQERLMEEKMEKPRIFSAASSGSSYHEEILLDEMTSAS